MSKERCNLGIFKAYDIRGEWQKDWDIQTVEKIVFGLVQVFKPKIVTLGYDMRVSTPIIKKEICKTFEQLGVSVYDIGQCSTEIVYFASHHFPQVDLAIMITASHNPPQDNGLKICIKNAQVIGLHNGLNKVKEVVKNETIISGNQKGEIIKKDIWSAYKEYIFSLANMPLNWTCQKKIVIDAGNGMGGVLIDNVLKENIPHTTKLFWEPDGSFPNHQPDPFKEKNVEELKKKVLEKEADLGVAFDGDADRIFFIDDKGRYIPGYYTGVLLTQYLLKQLPKGQTIVYDPRYFWATKEIVNEYQGIALPSKVGHTLIKEKMRQEKAVFSAECSGHIFYKENQYAESCVYTLLLLLKIIKEKKLSTLVDELFTQYLISGEHNFIVADTQKVIQKIAAKYEQADISYLDGISIESDCWRANVRSSNTQPLLRLNIEAKNQEKVEEKLKEFEEIIGGKKA